MPSRALIARAKGYINRLRLAVALIGLGMAAGIIGFMLIERYPLVDAFYMTVITLATVGFTEVHPLSPTGRIFTSFLILSNLGIFAFAVSTITDFFIEGDVRRLFRSYRRMQDIARLSDHVIVCGYGRIGRQVVQELLAEQRPFVLLEHEGSEAAALADDQGVLTLLGDATQEETLADAGILRARALIATLPKDADNLFIVLTARGMNPQLKIISRASEASAMPKLRQAGADYVILPERMGGTHMAALVTKPDVVQFIELLNTSAGVDLVLAEYPMREVKAEWIGKQMSQIDARLLTGANLIGLKSADGRFSINPPLQTQLQAEHTLIVLGTSEQIERFAQLAKA